MHVDECITSLYKCIEIKIATFVVSIHNIDFLKHQCQISTRT